MIKCPKCNNTLPLQAVICQFCGENVSQVPRPAQKEIEKGTYKLVSKGTMVGFYVVSGLTIILGGTELLVGLGLFGTLTDLVRNLWLVWGIIMGLVGLGLMFRMVVVYAMIGVVCSLQAILGIANVVTSIMTIDSNFLKYFLIVLSVVQALMAGFLFYYAEETAVRPMSAH